MSQLTQSKAQKPAVKKSSNTKHTVCLSSSMEKSFRSLKAADVREAFVEAHLVNGLAHQIRILREQRGWTQAELAKITKTTQTTISRFEDPSYGKYSIQTLLRLGKAFDVAFFVRYLSFSDFLQKTWDTSPSNFEASGYEEESSWIQSYTDEAQSLYVKPSTSDNEALVKFLDVYSQKWDSMDAITRILENS